MRIARACGIVKQLKLDGLIIEHPSDLFYLNGQWFSAGRLVLKPDGAVLLVDGRYFGQAQGKVPCEVVLSEKDSLQNALKGLKKIGFDSAFLTVEKAGLMEKAAPHKEWVPVPRPLKTLRVIKDAEEIDALKRAASVTADGYRQALKKLSIGIEEQEVSLDFEIHCRQKGASKLSFEPIVAFGENSACPHYRAGRAKLKKNQIVLLDLGAVVDHYRGDMTRVFFFGEKEVELARFYGLVREAHDLAAAAARPGVRFGDLDRIVREFFAEEGVAPLFSHSLGHGVGIDVHEYPLVRFDGEDCDLILEEGMVFTIEPGLYLSGVGGVRYENTYLVRANGLENFYAEL